MSRENVEILKRAADHPSLSIDRMEKQMKLIGGIRMLPEDSFPDSTLISDMIGYYPDGHEVYEKTEIEIKFDKFISALNINSTQELMIKNRFIGLAFPHINGKGVRELDYKITVGDVKDIINEGILQKLDRFHNGFDRALIRVLFVGS